MLKPGEKPVHALGLSIMDEATDFHAGIILKTSTEGAIRNISAEDFKKGFSKGWLQQFPAPSLLRYDEEGFMRSVKLASWLEVFGILATWQTFKTPAKPQRTDEPSLF